MEKNLILGKMERLCSRCEYCSSDIMMKIRRAMRESYTEEAAREILSSLKEGGYVDDLRYSSAFAREKSSLTGWGPVKIRFALAAKHIPPDVISEALSEIDADAAREKLVRLVEAKRKTLQGDPELKLKLIRFALSRGYDYPEVASVVDQAI